MNKPIELTFLGGRLSREIHRRFTPYAFLCGCGGKWWEHEDCVSMRQNTLMSMEAAVVERIAQFIAQREDQQ